MGIKFSNNASANIIQALTSTATSVSVTTGKGDLFPSLNEGDYFYATLAGNNGLEIVKVTNRVKDTMTIVRAQDNTTALSFDTGDLFELRIVAADFNDTLSHVETTMEDTLSNVETTLEDTVDTLNSSVDTKMSSYLPLSGGTMTGGIAFSGCGNVYSTSTGDYIGLSLYGDQNYSDGASMALRTAKSPSQAGYLALEAFDGQNRSSVTLRPSGGLYVGANKVITSAGGTMSGTLQSSASTTMTGTSTTQRLLFTSTPTWTDGAWMHLSGKDSENNGNFYISSRTKNGTVGSLIGEGTALTWCGNDIITSAGGTMKGTIRTGHHIFATRTDGTGFLEVHGGSANNDGAFLQLNGAARSDWPEGRGRWSLTAADGSGGESRLYGTPEGGLYLNNNSVLTSAGGNLTGALTFGNIGALYNSTSSTTESMNIGLAEGAVGRSAVLSLRSERATDAPGSFWLGARSTTNGDKYLTGRTDGWLGWMGSRVLTGKDIHVGGPSTTSFTLPAGGTWAYICVRNSGDTNVAQVGTAAGGTTINFGHEVPRVFAVRYV